MRDIESRCHSQNAMIDLENYFDLDSLQRGLDLFREGSVIELDFESNNNFIEARVQGTRSRPHEVEIYFNEHGKPDDAFCSCPVEFRCEHAVAALLAYQQLQSSPSQPHLAQPGGTPNQFASSHDADTLAQTWWHRWSASLNDRPVPTAYTALAGSRSRSRIYSLNPGKLGDKRGIGVIMTLLDAPRTVAGHFNKGRRGGPGNDYGSYDTELSTLDREIEALGAARRNIDKKPWSPDTGRYELNGRSGQAMLEMSISTGRCFLDNDRRQPLTVAQSRALSVDWQAVSKNTQRLVATLEGLDQWWPVTTDPPWWIDPASATAGPIQTQLSGEQLALLLEAPDMSEPELEALADLQTHNQSERGGHPLLPPPPVTVAPIIDVTPSPVLLLSSPDDDPHVDHWQLVLFMEYGNELLPFDPANNEPITRLVNDQGEPVRIKRYHNTETHYLIQTMAKARGLAPGYNEFGQYTSTFKAIADTPVERFNTYRRLVADMEELESDGWQLIVVPPVHTEPLRTGHFDGLVSPADDGSPGWFDISMGIQINGERYDLMPLVAAYIERGGGDEPLIEETTDGRFMEVPAAVLSTVADVLMEMGTSVSADGNVHLSRTRALALDSLEQSLGDHGVETNWRGTREPFQFAQQLRKLANVDTSAFDQTAIPRGLKATLRPYQRAGLGWLNAIATHDLCGILADDMGLGKTLQTLAHILWLRQSRRLKGPVLVVAPTSLLLNWSREAARFTPRLNVRVWHGLDRHDDPLDAEASQVHMVITSYGLALRDRDLLAEQEFGLLVLDEAQQIRNAQAKTTRAIKSLPIERRLCLSGTPLENHLGELWSQFDFLMPDLLGDAQRFTRHYRTPIERHGDMERQRRLAAAVSPFLLRRRKEEVATDLPPKTEMVREVHLGEAQAKLYESIRVSMQKRVRKALHAKGLAQSRVTVLDALLKLRQCCCHPELLKLDSARRVKESAKTNVALDMIDELIAEGRRILVFSSFTSMLAILERELASRDYSWVKLTGQTRKRDAAIDAFQRGEVPLFLISLKAGGVGLNLTAADTVIHYDPWWNPAAEAQASARAHRIGQDKPVFVYRLVTADTVEQRIVKMQQRKQDLADAMTEGGDGASLSALSVEETLALFDSE